MTFFQNGGKVLAGSGMNKEMVGYFVGMIIWLLLLLFFGKYLWNSVLTRLIPGIKPVTTIWQVLGLSVLFMILKGC